MSNKYKVGDSFLFPMRIDSIRENSSTPYFVSGVGMGYWSESALNDMEKKICADCKYKGKRHQKCSCCIRNRSLKDCYESEVKQ